MLSAKYDFGLEFKELLSHGNPCCNCMVTFQAAVGYNGALDNVEGGVPGVLLAGSVFWLRVCLIYGEGWLALSYTKPMSSLGGNNSLGALLVELKSKRCFLSCFSRHICHGLVWRCDDCCLVLFILFFSVIGGRGYLEEVSHYLYYRRRAGQFCHQLQCRPTQCQLATRRKTCLRW